MKQTFFSVLLLLGVAISGLNAQNYKLNKQVYDYKMYIPQPGDSYNPSTMGFASFFIPGLGQMLSGETGRGLAFLGGSSLLTGVTIIGALMSYTEVTHYNDFGSYTELETRPGGVALMLVGALSTIAVDIWSIVDATKVAKVNNMYMRDLRKNTSQVKVNVSPFIDAKYAEQQCASLGLSLHITF